MAATSDMVEPMSSLCVDVVKARDLPTMDITGALDPYVEVKLGNFKGVTRHLEKNANPVWRQMFAFSATHLQCNQLQVIVKHKDVLRDDFVGHVVFDMSDIPSRLIGTEKDRPLAPAITKIQMGSQIRRTWLGHPQGSANPAWNEEFMFVANEPFEDPLVVTVEEKVDAGRDEPIGRVIIPVASPYVPRNDLAQSVPSKWFNLSRGMLVDEAAVDVTASMMFASKIQLRMSLETAYHVLDEWTDYSSDLRPAAAF